MAINNDSLSIHHTHLFTVRLWLEVIDEHRVEVRGQVQHVLSGETHYFRNWEMLILRLSVMLATLGGKELGNTATPIDNRLSQTPIGQEIAQVKNIVIWQQENGEWQWRCEP